MPNTIILKNKKELRYLINSRRDGCHIVLSFVKKYNNYERCLYDYTPITSVIINVIMTYINDEFTIDFHITQVYETIEYFSYRKCTYRAMIISNDASINFQTYIFSYKTIFAFKLGIYDDSKHVECVNYYSNISNQILLYSCTEHYNYNMSIFCQSSAYHNNHKEMEDECVKINKLMLATVNNIKHDDNKLSYLMDSIDRNKNMTGKVIEKVYNLHNYKYEIKYKIVNHNMMINFMVIVQLIDKNVNDVLERIINC